VRSLLALTAGLAEGLCAIHKAGVVHRDLKPSNVLLAEDGPRVIDIGISGAAEASAAAAAGESVMIGSPGYMSPEQVLGYDIGLASDMFSLGAVLTFAATGQGPFGSGSPGALMYRLVNTPASLDEVPAEVRPLVGRCLAKHPGDRPTAGELLAEVGAIQPAPGWLAESIMNSFAQTQSAAAPAELAEIVAPTGTSTSAAMPPAAAPGPPRRGGPIRPGGAGRPGRHRISRPLASAGLTGGVVIGSAVAAFALIGANHTPTDRHGQPQAAAGSPATAPALGSGPSAGPSASPSKSVSPSAFLSPASARTSLAPTPISSAPTSSAPGQPAGSGSGSATPTKSAPSSSSPPSSSAPPSSAPPSSDPPSSTPPSSSPPPSSDPATTPASATPS
jgi:serine/threonine protein kinase